VFVVAHIHVTLDGDGCQGKFLLGGVGMDNLLSVEEAAKRLGGISKWTVHAWLSQGKLRRTKVGGRTMIRESELQKVIQDDGKSQPPKQRALKSEEAK
jgi:excisionase family DNA binding protein